MTDAHSERHDLTVPAELEGLRFDQALARLLSQHSRSRIKTWIEDGQAVLNGRPARPRAPVQAGDRVQVEAHWPAAEALQAQPVPFTLRYADEDVLVIDKPAGVVVHPGAGNRDATLINGLLARFPELAQLPRAGLIHRIDKDTSGLLLVARRPTSFQALIRAMAARRITRVYEAIVTGVLVAGGTIDAPIGRDPQQRTRMRVTPNGRTAVTHYRVLQRYRAHTHIEVRLETGRTHQIRVHMAWQGHALVGDPRYAGRPRPPRGASHALQTALTGFSRQALHAAALGFTHPVSGEPIAVEAPRPADLDALMAALTADAESAA
ncbi:MAG: 23S rRNA pseudouridine(1911/1915/1917) synthase RluD [Gammaproteobacteria bacterium]